MNYCRVKQSSAICNLVVFLFLFSHIDAQTVKCYRCSGRDCPTPDEKYIVECEPRPLSDCFTIHTEFNVTRGCESDLDNLIYECSGFHHSCGKGKCQNNQESRHLPCNKHEHKLEYKCFKCSSKSDPDCAKPFSKHEFEHCTSFNGCYERSSGGVATRGCTSSLSKSEISECKKEGNKKCRLCDSPICNREKIDNSASGLVLSNIMLAVAVLLMSAQSI